MSYELTKDRNYKHKVKMKLLHNLHMPLCNSTSFHFHSNSNNNKKNKHHKSFSRNSSNSYIHYHHPTFYALTRNVNNNNNNSSSNSNVCCKLKSIQDYKNEIKCIMQQYSYTSPQHSRFNI